MSEMICVECGAIITEEMSNCPNCGCPRYYQEKGREEELDANDMHNYNGGYKGGRHLYVTEINKSERNKNAKISLVIGLLVVVMGIVLIVLTPLAHYTWHYSVDDVTFGADFYTEIYKSTSVIVDELYSIDSGMEALSVLTKGIYRAMGMLIIAIGLGIVSISIINMGKSPEYVIREE